MATEAPVWWPKRRRAGEKECRRCGGWWRGEGQVPWRRDGCMEVAARGGSTEEGTGEEEGADRKEGAALRRHRKGGRRAFPKNECAPYIQKNTLVTGHCLMSVTNDRPLAMGNIDVCCQ